MQFQKILELWKQIIYISGFYKHYKKSDKEKIVKKLESFKAKLSKNNDKYSKKLIWFLDDLLWDLAKNKPLQIDKIFEDDFVGNYYNTKKQVEIYNNLLDEKLYEKIISMKNLEKNNDFLDKIYETFKKNYNILDKKLISSSLLIFTTFDYKSPKKDLVRLYNFRNIYKLSEKSIQKIEKILKYYELFLEKIYNFWLENLEKNTIAYKYIKASKNKTNENIAIDFKLVDVSKENGRTWFYKEEYKEILRNLR